MNRLLSTTGLKAKTKKLTNTNVSRPNAQQLERVHKRARFNSASQRGTQHSNTQPQTEEQASSHSTASPPNAQQLERMQQKVSSNTEETLVRRGRGGNMLQVGQPAGRDGKRATHWQPDSNSVLLSLARR